MPASIPVPVRRQMLQMHEQGRTLAVIARQLNLSRRTVSRLLRRAADNSVDGLLPRYDHAPHHRCALEAKWRDELMQTAEDHPTWGATYLRLRLSERHPQVDWPSARTMQRWIEAVRPRPAPPGRKPTATSRARAGRPHEVWQIDAVDQLALGNGQKVCWLRMTDECSGAFLQTKVFSPDVLSSGARTRCATSVSSLFFSLGLAPSHPRRQRQSLGNVERLAASPGLVADRFGHRDNLERPGPSAAKRRGRTFARNGQALERTEDLPVAGGTPTPPGRGRSPAARSVSACRGTQSPGSPSRSETFGTALHRSDRTKPVGFATSTGASEPLYRESARRCIGNDLALESNALRRPALCATSSVGTSGPKRDHVDHRG